MYLQLFPVVLLLLIFNEKVYGTLTSGSKVCMDIFEAESNGDGTGCVTLGSLSTETGQCARCAFNYQCQTGWCHQKTKICYKQGVKCKTRNVDQAGCADCPSDPGVDFSLCNCTNPDFPNNWVKCNDGSERTDSYDIAPKEQYVRKDGNDGSLAPSDKFAQYALCYHNDVRQAVGLQPLQWNSDLALWATNWVEHLKGSNECRIKHSKNRNNIGGFWAAGENLARKQFAYGITNNQIPRLALNAFNGWYSELINYQYAGPDAGAGSCPFRNQDVKQKPKVLHVTQVLWSETTDIGCDYAICEPNEKGHSYAAVSCVYGPAGNARGLAVFNDTVYCKLNNNHEIVQRFGTIPRCDGKKVDCDNLDSWTTESPASSEKDGKCITKQGRTCSFPWYRKGHGTYESCQDAVNRRGKPICYTQEEKWDQCPSDSLDPDCQFVMLEAE